MATLHKLTCLAAGIAALGMQACSTAPDGREAAVPASGVVELREAGLYANYYPAETQEPGPAILLLGGSEGGLNPLVSEEAELLRGLGYSVLQLSFYRSPGQPDNLEMVPLETFDRGLDWLIARSEVDPARVGIFGTSKGAEAALITATRHPDEIASVVAVVPSSVSWQGINWAFDQRPAEASWSLAGEAYPALPYGDWDPATGLYSLYENGLKAVDSHPETAIKVEQTEAPKLLICGSADALWPSCDMSYAIQNRATLMEGPEVTILAYEGAGHGAGGAPRAEFDPATAAEPLDFGGTRGANRAARIDGWPKTLAFLERTLKE